MPKLPDQDMLELQPQDALRPETESLPAVEQENASPEVPSPTPGSSSLDITEPNHVDRKTRILQIIALVFVIALTAALILLRNKIPDMEKYGYPGIFVLSIIANATVILPIPGVLITSAMGAVYNPLLVAVCAGAGAAIGEMSGYLAGFSGRAVIEKAAWHEKVVNWMRKYGDPTILVLAIIPNPAFDIAGIIAGMLKVPVWRYLLWCTIGKIIKMLAFAYGGAAIFSWFK
ncbi:MAG TPA: VTT domain-containing protein [Anaerolineaceae bacterium]|nr:VTT domain-containing protein [Anaerolineaceae bacterium]